jgi:hypothetical protein
VGTYDVAPAHGGFESREHVVLRSESLTFRKSSYSSAKGQDCVEVADFPGGSAVRDTRHREAGHLAFSGREWAALVSTACVLGLRRPA